ncbi:MAG: hypothetical protein ACJ8F3_11280 [Xanthobacteraceae bacterium]
MRVEKELDGRKERRWVDDHRVSEVRLFEVEPRLAASILKDYEELHNFREKTGENRFVRGATLSKAEQRRVQVLKDRISAQVAKVAYSPDYNGAFEDLMLLMALLFKRPLSAAETREQAQAIARLLAHEQRQHAREVARLRALENSPKALSQAEQVELVGLRTTVAMHEWPPCLM